MLLDSLLLSKFTISRHELDPLPATELTQYLHKYLFSCAAENKSSKTRKSYASFIGYFIKFLVGSGLETNIADIGRDHIRVYTVSLQERGLTPETVNTYYRTLHTFFNWLQTERYVKEIDNPFLLLKAPKVPKKHVQGYTADIIDRVIALCSVDDSFVGKRSFAMVLVFLDSLIRMQELVNMKINDIYFDQGLIKVMGKGQKERIVVMGKISQENLLRYLLMRKDSNDAVWVAEDGHPLTMHGVKSAIRRLADRAGIPKTMKRGTHAYRHTGATCYLRNNGNVKSLQELLGHADIKTTMKYVDALGQEKMIKDHLIASPVDNLFRTSQTAIDTIRRYKIKRVKNEIS